MIKLCMWGPRPVPARWASLPSSVRMASQNQVQEVQQQIEAVVGEVSEVKTSLAAAEEAADGDKVRFLRDRLVQLDRERVILREKENKLLVVQSGASGPGRLTYDELYSKLSQTKGHVDSKVLSHMIRFFAAEILLANQDILSDLYDAAKASPLSSTKASLREDEGLIFNGAFVAGTPSRAVLLIAFENGAMPKGYGHNDVKATNIFISAAGECILGDFGSALELGAGGKLWASLRSSLAKGGSNAVT
ncbi:hypothetical protein WJX82_005218 [Trebouxia sp. C0006]